MRVQLLSENEIENRREQLGGGLESQDLTEPCPDAEVQRGQKEATGIYTQKQTLDRWSTVGNEGSIKMA